MTGGPDALRRALARIDEGIRGDIENVRLLRFAVDCGCLPSEDAGMAHYLLGIELKTLGDPESALLHFEHASLLAEPHVAVGAHDSAGGILVARGRFSEAESHYRAALSFDCSHPFAADWLVLLATCVGNRAEHLSTDELDEMYSLVDEAYALLTGPTHDEFVTDYPYPRAVLQAMVVRATCAAMYRTPEALGWAEEQFRAAETYGNEHLGPDLSVCDMKALYENWIAARYELGNDDDAERLIAHAQRRLQSG